MFACLRKTVERMGFFDTLASGRSDSYWERGLEPRQKRRTRSQYARILQELDIAFIPDSVQSRGPCARLMRTLRDRLPKEMARALVSDISEANEFLAHYWSRLNSEFAVPPEDPRSAFEPLVSAPERTLDNIFCQKREVNVGADRQLAYRGRILGIAPQGQHPSGKVLVHEYADGSLAVYQGRARLAQYDPPRVVD